MTPVKYTLSEHADALAAYLPNGRTFEAKNTIVWSTDKTPVRIGSNLRLLLEGIAGEFKRAHEYLLTLEEEYLPDQTVLFLDEWERAVGIPDSCFAGTGTDDERRRDILVKLASLGVQTVDDFIDLAALFGITVEVIPGYDEITFPLTFPVLMFDAEWEARYTIIVKFIEESPAVFPLTFPIIFGSGEIATLECLFNKVKPANCEIIFQQVV